MTPIPRSGYAYIAFAWVFGCVGHFSLLYSGLNWRWSRRLITGIVGWIIAILLAIHGFNLIFQISPSAPEHSDSRTLGGQNRGDDDTSDLNLRFMLHPEALPLCILGIVVFGPCWVKLRNGCNANLERVFIVWFLVGFLIFCYGFYLFSESPYAIQG